MLAPRENLLASNVAGFGDEGRVAVEALEEDDAQGPPVARLVVARPADHFGAHVRVCPDHAVGELLPVLLPPSKNASRLLVIFIMSHGKVRKVSVQTGSESGSTGQETALIEIDTMFAQELSALLIVVCAVMCPVKVRRQPKVAQLNVPIGREDEIVGLVAPKKNPSAGSSVYRRPAKRSP